MYETVLREKLYTVMYKAVYKVWVPHISLIRLMRYAITESSCRVKRSAGTSDNKVDMW